MKTPKQAKRKVGAKRLSIKIRHDHTGWEFSCPIGLWSVCGPNKQQVFREAMHYFAQYWESGEYDHLFTPQAFNLIPPQRGKEKK